MPVLQVHYTRSTLYASFVAVCICTVYISLDKNSDFMHCEMCRIGQNFLTLNFHLLYKHSALSSDKYVSKVHDMKEILLLVQ